MENIEINNQEFYEDEKFGRVPIGWEIKRLKDIFDFFPTSSYSRSKLIEQGEVGYIHYGDIHTKFNRVLDLKKDVLPFIPKELMKKHENLKDGDVIVSDASEDWEGVGKCIEIINIEDKKIISGLHTLHLRPKSDDFILGFKGYIFCIYQVAINIKSLATGMKVYGISKPNLGRVLLPIPPKPEQTAIATILSKVDEAIEATRQSIKAAEKLKKALMQNLLTGKLKPDGTWRTEVEFYDDEKFGKVPVGWEVKKVGDKSICSINPNYKFDKGREYDFIPMDAVNDKFRGVSYLEKRKIEGGGYTRFKLGDILFAKITPCTENGKVALIDKINTNIGFASTEFIIFQPKETIDNTFYYYILSSDRVHNLSVSLMEGTTGRQRVPWKVFKNRVFAPIPNDINEQISISSKLKSIEMDNIQKQTKIQTLQRLKKSLMQNLLTGKVRLDVEAINKIISEQ